MHLEDLTEGLEIARDNPRDQSRFGVTPLESDWLLLDEPTGETIARHPTRQEDDMRNTISRKLIASLLTATVAGFFAVSIMPKIECETRECVVAPGHLCYQGGKVHIGYKLKMNQA